MSFLDIVFVNSNCVFLISLMGLPRYQTRSKQGPIQAHSLGRQGDKTW